MRHFFVFKLFIGFFDSSVATLRLTGFMRYNDLLREVTGTIPVGRVVVVIICTVLE